jgi:hypothetical protein
MLHPQFSTSLHFRTFRHHASKDLHFPSLTITFLTLFLKTCELQQEVASASAGTWFRRLIVLFTKEYLWVQAIPEEQRALTNYNRRHRRHNISIPVRPHKSRSPNKSSGKGWNPTCPVVASKMLYCSWRGMYQDTAVKLKEDKLQDSRYLKAGTHIAHPHCSIPVFIILLQNFRFYVS